MRISMGIVRNQHGVFHLRKKVPKKLEEAVALVTDTTKPRVAWLKKTLNTKDHKAAKVRAAPVLMEFDRILAKASRSSRRRLLPGGDTRRSAAAPTSAVAAHPKRF